MSGQVPEQDPGQVPGQVPGREHTGDDHVAGDLVPDLAGDMGVSSERVDPDGGVQGTGSTASTQGRTSGASPTYPGEEIPVPRTTIPGVPEDELTENPAEVPSHELDPGTNPGHSHG